MRENQENGQRNNIRRKTVNCQLNRWDAPSKKDVILSGRRKPGVEESSAAASKGAVTNRGAKGRNEHCRTVQELSPGTARAVRRSFDALRLLRMTPKFGRFAKIIFNCQLSIKKTIPQSYCLKSAIRQPPLHKGAFRVQIRIGTAAAYGTGGYRGCSTGRGGPAAAGGCPAR